VDKNHCRATKEVEKRKKKKEKRVKFYL